MTAALRHSTRYATRQLAGRLQQWDRDLLGWFYQRSFTPSLWLKILIFIGDGPFWMLVLLASALYGQLANSLLAEQLAQLLMLALALANFLFVPLKKHVHRRRPYANPQLQQRMGIRIVNRDPGHGSKELESFPSGHALWTTLSVLLIGYQCGLMSFLALVWLIPLMMVLRPYLGVHYPSDTLIGFALGAVIALLTVLLSPFVFVAIGQIKLATGAFYTPGYWLFLTGFLIVGVRSWLKRV